MLSNGNTDQGPKQQNKEYFEGIFKCDSIYTNTCYTCTVTAIIIYKDLLHVLAFELKQNWYLKQKIKLIFVYRLRWNSNYKWDSHEN